ncbi:polyhydroxybutyrate depolymerase [Mycobacterium sp. KBS0706]|uniref:extracellular catalytic domain type 1 short-chain-length polyhydroxyalkanoate depolymerase n=1 Tax=Mycobacterium sp. KBS0706 TaxID=2578109 RepID=UPI00110FA161|nr:alpha/beta fold hydrolase [Mycobacterium sp. KBS0706]TSD88419.1 polyhydroxybutyrate depolymerase [Mycobacterium sp. KBS0706]
MTRRLSQALAFPVAILALLLSTAPGRAAGTDVDATLPVDGVSRSYTLHLPPAAAGGNPLPLVVVLHGGGANADSAIALTGFSAEADAEGFIVAYPNGTGRLKPTAETAGQFSWNAGDCCGAAMRQDADDVGFLRALVSTIEQERAVDRHRIYAAGFSAGGMMAYRLACEAGDIFAGVAVVSGAILVPSCTPSRPVSVIHIHGTDDEAVPFKGTAERESYARAKFPPVQESVTFWAAFDGCQAQPVARATVLGIKVEDYPDCRAGTAVRFDVVEGGIHAWPDGTDTPGFTATPHIWRFFADHPRL